MGLQVEADDAMAAAAAIAAKDDRVDQVIICTPDKDLGQCVGGKVFQLDRRQGILFDAAAVEVKFGVPPAAIPDYLALVGDSADASGFAPTDLLDIDPLLGPLADNGGPTLTMALLPGSPAIDAGDNTDAPEWDQRGPGLPRIVDGTIDIGAFEVQATGISNPPSARRPPPSARRGSPDPAVLVTAALFSIDDQKGP